MKLSILIILLVCPSLFAQVPSIYLTGYGGYTIIGNTTIGSSGLTNITGGNITIGTFSNITTITNLTGYNYTPISNQAVNVNLYYTNGFGKGIQSITMVNTASISVGALAGIFVFQQNGIPVPGGYYSTGAEIGLGVSATNTLSFPLGYREYFAITNLGNALTITTNWLAY